MSVIGCGAAGMVSAWRLSQKYDVTVYEKSARLGWYTIKGGTSQYIKLLSAILPKAPLTDCGATCDTRTDKGVVVEDSMGGTTLYDQVVFACHADSALALLTNPSSAEKKCPGAFHFVENRSVCHRDPTLMPERKKPGQAGVAIMRPIKLPAVSNWPSTTI